MIASGIFIPAITKEFDNKSFSESTFKAFVNGDPLKMSANKMISSSAVISFTNVRKLSANSSALIPSFKLVDNTSSRSPVIILTAECNPGANSP